MSWSCSYSGDKDDVREKCIAALEASATMYDGYATAEGKQEAQDVRDAKRAVLDALDSMTLDADSYGPNGYTAMVSAYGSRSQGSVTISVSVSKSPKSA